MYAHCKLCGSQDIRLSHLRPSDLAQFLSLRYPVRCRDCGEREHCSVWDALQIRMRGRKRRHTQPEANTPADSNTPPRR